jgi:hypothetical protein
MRTFVGPALLAATLMLGVSAQIAPAAAESMAAKKAQPIAARDAGARRYHAYRPNYPYPMYYARPVYYAPKPFLPIPPLWGYGWEWW